MIMRALTLSLWPSGRRAASTRARPYAIPASAARFVALASAGSTGSTCGMDVGADVTSAGQCFLLFVLTVSGQTPLESAPQPFRSRTLKTLSCPSLP